MSKQNKCRDFCILWVKTNDRKSLFDAMLPRRSRRIKITDYCSEEERAAAKRRRILGLREIDPKYRYYGVISSLNHVKGACVSEHVSWVLSNFKSSFSLAELAVAGAEYGISHGWWSGMGTGYGPVISPEVGALLVKHNVELEISLYG